MKSFKQFIQENDPFTGCENILIQEELQKKSGGYTHSFAVGPHKVDVDYAGNGSHYLVNFHVNGSTKKSVNDFPSDEHSKQILHHVGASIHGFIKDKKPKSMTFWGNTTHKADMYKKFANHLAKHYKGSASTLKLGDESIGVAHAHSVDFPQ